MSQVSNEGVAITLKTRCKSTGYTITSLSYSGSVVTSANLSIDYVKEKFYQIEEEEETIVTSETLVTTTTASKGESEVIDYEAAVTSALTSRL